MPKVEFDVVRPNLHVFENNIYFGIRGCDIISVSNSIDAIARVHIDSLKVKESDLNIAQFGLPVKKQKNILFL